MNQNIIAFKGEVEVLDASWSLRDGRQVTFRLCGEPFGRIHPFKQYQQRRGGKVGTRFRASFARAATGEALNTFDLMLASWKDSSTAGQQVTFWIDDEPDAHPFCGCTYRQNGTPGEIFALVLVELDDEDKPVDQSHTGQHRSGGSDAGSQDGVHEQRSAGSIPSSDSEAPAQTAAAVAGYGERPAGGAAGNRKGARKLSSTAHLLVSSALFVRYLQETKANLIKEWSSDKARVYAKGLISVESLSDLDRNQDAAHRYHELIRKPYDKWYRQDPP